MTRLFGTDGIRGVANLDLRPSLAFALGRATAHQVVGAGRRRWSSAATPAARATCSWRRSPPARRAWAPTSTRSGIVPTPALAFLAADGDFAAGIMVSASHNPAEDNGLKVLDPRGLKLDDDVEDELEAAVLRADELPGVAPGSIGRAFDAGHLLARYVAHRRGAGRGRRRERPPRRAGHGERRRVPRRARDPARDRRAGDRDPRRPRRRQHQPRRAARPPRPRSPRPSWPPARTSGSRSTGTRTGASPWTAQGNLVDGDQVLGILALERLARGALDHGSLVVSVLSNGGLQAAVEAVGGRLVRTPVGDKHILAAMLVSGAGLGGEKSGHVIIREHTTSGDGIVTAIELLRVMTAAGAGIAELATAVPLLPAAAARDPGPPPRPVGGRRRPRGVHRRRGTAARAARPGPRASLGHRARPAGHGRGPATRRSSPSSPTPSRRSQATDYTSQPRRGRELEPKEIPQAHVRHRRLHRAPRGGPDPDRGAAPPRVPRLRLGGHRARRRAGRPVRREEGGQARQPPDRDRGPDAARGHRARAHALGDARAAERPQRPSPPGLHGRHHGHPQRDHRELPRPARRARGARPHAHVRDGHRGDRAPRRGGLRRATSPTPCARRCASSRAPTRSS